MAYYDGMRRIGDDLLLEALKQREDYVQGAANAIDTKASQAIAAAAFLAVQPAALLLATQVPVVAIIIQLAGYVSITFALYHSHRALDIRDYPSPGFPQNWCADLVNEMPGSSDNEIRETMLWALVKQAEGRVEEGLKVNEQRIASLRSARAAISWSLAANIGAFFVTVTMRLLAQ